MFNFIKCDPQKNMGQGVKIKNNKSEKTFRRPKNFGWPTKISKSRCARARRQLRKCLQQKI